VRERKIQGTLPEAARLHSLPPANASDYTEKKEEEDSTLLEGALVGSKSLGGDWQTSLAGRQTL
jgi:hypothetical protein